MGCFVLKTSLISVPPYVHQMQVGAIFHLSLCPNWFPSSDLKKKTKLISIFIPSAVFLRMVHLIPLRLMKYVHSFSVTLQCFLFLSQIHRKSIWSITVFPFSLCFPGLKQVFLWQSYVKQATLYGIFPFGSSSKATILNLSWDSTNLSADFTLNLPFLSSYINLCFSQVRFLPCSKVL